MGCGAAKAYKYTAARSATPGPCAETDSGSSRSTAVGALNGDSSNDDFSSDSGSEVASALPTIEMCDSSRDILLQWRKLARARRLPDFDPLEATLPHPKGKIAPPPCKAGDPARPDPAPLSPMPALPPTPPSTTPPSATPRQPAAPSPLASAKPAAPPLDAVWLLDEVEDFGASRRRLFAEPPPSPRETSAGLVPTPCFGAPTPAFGGAPPPSPRGEDLDCVGLRKAPVFGAWSDGPPPSPSSAGDAPRVEELMAFEAVSPVDVGSPLAWAGRDPVARDRVEGLLDLLEAAA